MEHSGEHTTLIGTISGTLLSVVVTIDLQDITKTIVLAAVGALVSFLMTLFLKWIVKKILQ